MNIVNMVGTPYLTPQTRPTTSQTISLEQFLAELRNESLDGDATFAALAMQIRTSEADVTRQMDKLKRISAFREKIEGHLTLLRRIFQIAKDECKNDGDDDDKISLWAIAQKLYAKDKPIKGAGPFDDKEFVATLTRVQQMFDEYSDALYRPEFSVGVETGEFSIVNRKTDPMFQLEQQDDEPRIGEEIVTQKTQLDMMLRYPPGELLEKQEKFMKAQISVTELEKEIENVGRYSTQLDNTREMDTIKLNSFINKKSQFTELLSNILKRTNDTRSAVIQNVR